MYLLKFYPLECANIHYKIPQQTLLLFRPQREMLNPNSQIVPLHLALEW